MLVENENERSHQEKENVITFIIRKAKKDAQSKQETIYFNDAVWRTARNEIKGRILMTESEISFTSLTHSHSPPSISLEVLFLITHKGIKWIRYTYAVSGV